jgi:hypothetical protein
MWIKGRGRVLYRNTEEPNLCLKSERAPRASRQFSASSGARAALGCTLGINRGDTMSDPFSQFWSTLYQVNPGFVTVIAIVAVWQVVIKPIFFTPKHSSAQEALLPNAKAAPTLLDNQIAFCRNLTTEQLESIIDNTTRIVDSAAARKLLICKSVLNEKLGETRYDVPCVDDLSLHLVPNNRS